MPNEEKSDQKPVSDKSEEAGSGAKEAPVHGKVLTEKDFGDKEPISGGPGIDEKPATEETPEKPAEPEKQYAYKTFDEYETDRTEKEKRMHEATQEAASLKRQLEGLTQSMAMLAQKVQQTGTTKQEDDIESLQAELTRGIEEINFQDDPDARKKLAKLMIDANVKMQNVMSKKTASETERKAKEEANHSAFKSRLQPLGLDKYYNKLVLPTIDRLLVENPAFKYLTGDEQFKMIVQEVKSLIEEVGGNMQKGQDQLNKNLKDGGSLGRGSKTPAQEKDNEDTGLGSVSQDMKEIRKKRALPASVF